MKQAIESYLLHLKLANKSENTIRQYRGSLLDFARHAEVIQSRPEKRSRDTARVDVEHIERYLTALHQRQLSKASVHRALACVKSLCRWMADEGLLKENPAEAFIGPRQPHRVQRTATEKEVQQFIEKPISSSFPERDRLILELLYGSGLRCDEVANIRIEDFADPDLLLVTKGKGNKQRYVLLTDYAQDALKLYLKKRADILGKRARKDDTRTIAGLFFGLSGGQIDALTPRSIYRIVVKSATDAGLPWLSPHDLRRAFATHMDEHGAQHIVISQLLGHGKLSVTERYIAAASPQRLKKAYDRARCSSQSARESETMTPAKFR